MELIFRSFDHKNDRFDSAILDFIFRFSLRILDFQKMFENIKKLTYGPKILGDIQFQKNLFNFAQC